MEYFEKVEKLREKANVSFEEAKEALENSNWDILDAMIYLEQNGKVKGPEQTSYTTQNEQLIIDVEPEQEYKESFSDLMNRFWKWCMRWVEKGNRNSFCVEKNNKEILRVPITLLVVLLVFAFWVVLPLMVVGLFFNMRYHFAGPDIKVVDIDINAAMDDAANAAENIKKEMTDMVNKENQHKEN